MKTILFILLIITHNQLLFAQLNCKTTSQSDGSAVNKCFHKNGKVSTVETWDKDKRNGTLKGFNNQGKELFSHNLRHYGGHASAQITYFPNGQVKSIYYSDAPDGGIQYYNSTTQFNEVKNQTSFDERSNLDELHLRVPAPFVPRIPDTIKPKKPVVEINQVLVKQKEEPIEFRIINKTKLSHELLIAYTAIPEKDTVLKINAKKKLNYTVFTDSKKESWERLLDFTLLGNRKRFELIRGKEEVIGNRKVVTWYIIKSWNYKTNDYPDNLSIEK
jgi:hypothetical protein